MSLKAIKEALDELSRRRAGYGVAPPIDAYLQLNAIEQAAVVVVDASADLLTNARHDEYRAGMDTLRTIAKEAP